MTNSAEVLSLLRDHLQVRVELDGGDTHGESAVRVTVSLLIDGIVFAKHSDSYPLPESADDE